MNTLTITPADYRNFYFYRYYNDQRFIIKVMRLVGGPLLILVGLSYYAYGRLTIGFSLFLIGYGVYYILRPLLEVLIRNPKETSFTYQLENNHLIIQDGSNYSKLNLFDYPLRSNKRYFYLHGENKNVIFFPKKSLPPEISKEFEAKAMEFKEVGK